MMVLRKQMSPSLVLDQDKKKNIFKICSKLGDFQIKKLSYEF